LSAEDTCAAGTCCAAARRSSRRAEAALIGARSARAATAPTSPNSFQAATGASLSSVGCGRQMPGTPVGNQLTEGYSMADPDPSPSIAPLTDVAESHRTAIDAILRAACRVCSAWAKPPCFSTGSACARQLRLPTSRTVWPRRAGVSPAVHPNPTQRCWPAQLSPRADQPADRADSCIVRNPRVVEILSMVAHGPGGQRCRRGCVRRVCRRCRSVVWVWR
jgi:hypothetical protein